MVYIFASFIPINGSFIANFGLKTLHFELKALQNGAKTLQSGPKTLQNRAKTLHFELKTLQNRAKTHENAPFCNVFGLYFATCHFKLNRLIILNNTLNQLDGISRTPLNACIVDFNNGYIRRGLAA